MRWTLSWRPLTAVVAAVVLLAAGTVGAMAASSQALPTSPAYPLRYAGEGIRLAVASPVGREHLRIDFARDRFRQAKAVVRDNRADAKQLIADGSQYLDQTRRDLSSLSADQQGQVESEINQAGDDQKSAENQVDQQGDQGQN
jgi:gas vesicle protein